MQVKIEWNLGTLIPLGAMAVALAVAWGNLTTTVESIQARIASIEKASDSDDLRLRALETSQSNMTARLDAIGDAIDELKAGQRETNSLLREISKGRMR